MTTEWLETDPANGMLIGPDGCHYANEKQAAHFGLLGLCGCGNPEGSYNFCRQFLQAHDSRTDDDRPWPPDIVEKLVANNPAMAAHVLAHLFTHLDLLEHGGSVGGSWLTTDGARIVDMGEMTEGEMHQNYPSPLAPEGR